MQTEPEKLYPRITPKTEALFASGPNFFRRAPKPDNCFTQGGFEIGEGWYPIAQRLAERIEALLVDLDESVRQEVRCLQIKEKFAELRVYFSAPKVLHESVKAAVAEAVAESRRTCEQCGAPGRRVNPADWVLVVCEAHLQAYLTRRNITLDGPLPDEED